MEHRHPKKIPSAQEMVNRKLKRDQAAFDILEERVVDTLSASNGFNAVVVINKDEEKSDQQ